MKYRKYAWTVMCSLWCLMAVMGLGACEDDGEPLPMFTEKSLLTNRQFDSAVGDLEIVWNDRDTLGVAAFSPADADTTRMYLALRMVWGQQSGVNYGAYFPLMELGVTPGEDAIFLACDTVVGSHALQVQGRYDEAADRLQLRGTSRMVLPQLADREFTFTYGPDCLQLVKGSDWVMEGPDGPMGESEFVEQMLRAFGNELAGRMDGMKFVFHSDYTYQWWVKRVGEADYALWADAKYWLDPTGENVMMLSLPGMGFENEFYELICGDYSHVSSFTPPFESELVRLTYDFTADGQLSLRLHPFSANLMANFYWICNAGSFSEEESAWVREFVRLLDYEGGFVDADWWWNAEWVIGHTSSEAADI